VSPQVEAATRAWLARLPASERLAAAARTDARLIAWLGAGVVVVAVSLVVARSGLLPALRRRIEAERPRPWLTSAALAAALALPLFAALSVYDAGVAAWDDRLQGAAPRLGERLAHALAGVPPLVGAAVLVASALLAMARRRPRSWPWLAGGAFALICVAVGWGPYAAGSTEGLAPAPQGEVSSGLLRLASAAGVPVRQIYLSPDPTFDADVTGAFGRATVAVGRPTLRWPADQARALVGHLMGHWAHGDMLAIYLIWGLSALAALVAYQAWGAPLARVLGARDATAASAPEALPAAAVVLMLALAGSTLALNGYLSWANVRADAFSLDHAREPDGLAAVIEREWDHQRVDPTPLERAVFYSHPPLVARLRHAMVWRAAHGG
jgi:STE24 endopeptidase